MSCPLGDAGTDLRHRAAVRARLHADHALGAPALDDGAKQHGCSVHIVTAELDDGPIVAQHQVAVNTADDQDRLAARVLAEEHKLYPAVIGAIAAGLITIRTDQGQLRLDHRSGAIPGHIPGMEQHMQWPLPTCPFHSKEMAEK
ncbi:MAG: hypothetical protein EBS68_16455 [Rhodobacteraceae bacterium]|nr:hypothetical protein [Paracoccaceae bacterium]